MCILYMVSCICLGYVYTHTAYIVEYIYIYIYIYTVYIMYRYAIYVDSHCICNHVHRCITNAYLLYIICITHIYIYT